MSPSTSITSSSSRREAQLCRPPSPLSNQSAMLLLAEKNHRRNCNVRRSVAANDSESDDSNSSDDSDYEEAIDAPAAELVRSALACTPKRAKQRRKRVRWSTITVHEFGVGLGGSAVPSKGGASIGLAAAPEFTWTTKVGEMAERSEGVHRFSPDQRKRLLQGAGVEDVMIERYARETNIILGSRRRTFLEDLAEKRKEKLGRKRDADQALLERPCAAYSRRPRMIPTNYV